MMDAMARFYSKMHIQDVGCLLFARIARSNPDYIVDAGVAPLIRSAYHNHPKTVVEDTAISALEALDVALNSESSSYVSGDGRGGGSGSRSGSQSYSSRVYSYSGSYSGGYSGSGSGRGGRRGSGGSYSFSGTLSDSYGSYSYSR